MDNYDHAWFTGLIMIIPFVALYDAGFDVLNNIVVYTGAIFCIVSTIARILSKKKKEDK